MPEWGSEVSDVDAVVLVGGKGTRLRPLTLSAPKPMLPTAGVPFLAHLLAAIRAAGMRHVVLATSYRAEVFTAYFGDGSAHGLEIEYVVEDEPLDTGGAIRNVAGLLRHDDVLVFNGDILSGVDPAALVAAHRAATADVTLQLVTVDDPTQFGSVPTTPDGRVLEFAEKSSDPPADQINAGCYVFRRPVLEKIPAGRPVSVERETFPGLLEAGARLHGHVDTSYWLDVGTPQAFVRGSADLVTGAAPTYAPCPGAHGGDHIVLPSAEVAADAVVDGGSTIGTGAVVDAGARVSGSVLFDGARVGAGAVVEASVVGAGADVGTDAVLAQTVVGDRARVGARCELRAGARVWPDVAIPDGGVRFSTDA